MLRAALLALCLVAVTPAAVHRSVSAGGGVIKTHIQTIGNTVGTCGTTCAMATFAAPVGSGNAVLSEMLWNDNGTGSITVTSVVDDKGNSYVLGTKVHDPSSNLAAQSFWRGNVTGGPTTFTVTFSGSAVTAILIKVDEYSGAIAVTDPSDGNTGQFQNGVGGTDALTSGNITTTGVNDLIWGGHVNLNGVLDFIGTGFTSRGNQASYVLIEDKNLAAPGTTAATFTWASSGNVINHVVAIK